jgi:short-subunit dehydrogenase
MLALQTELHYQQTGVRMNIVCPYHVNTDFIRAKSEPPKIHFPQECEQLLAGTPLLR